MKQEKREKQQQIKLQNPYSFMVLLYHRNLFYSNVRRKGKPFMDYLSVVTVTHLWQRTGKTLSVGRNKIQ